MILAISTTTSVSSIALGDPIESVVDRFESRQAVARELQWRIDRLVAGVGARPGDIEVIAVDRGPGSFTGTRIGVATARALARALGVPITAAASTAILVAMGRRLVRPRGAPLEVVAAVRSKTGEMFVGIDSGGEDPPGPPVILRHSDAAAFAAEHRGALAVGAPWLEQEVAASVEGVLQPGPPHCEYPDAATLLLMAMTMPDWDPSDVVPLYVRVSQPEAAGGHGPSPWTAEPVRVRPCSRQDLAAIISIEEECFRTPWPPDEIARDYLRNPAAHYVVAETASGAIVGYACMWTSADRAHVASIAVRPAYRRRHIALRLMLALFDECRARRITHLTLEYRTSNEAARSMYSRLGFSPVSTRRGYYTDTGEDAIVVAIPRLDDPELQARHSAVRALLDEGDAG